MCVTSARKRKTQDERTTVFQPEALSFRETAVNPFSNALGRLFIWHLAFGTCKTEFILAYGSGKPRYEYMKTRIDIDVCHFEIKQSGCEPLNLENEL